MIKNKRKRDETTYLKMIDGEVVKTSNPYPKEDDEIVKENNSFHEYNQKIEETKPKGKYKIMSIVSALFILIPILLLGVKVATSSISEIQNFMILEGGKTDINTSKPIIITPLLEVSNTFNQSLTINYNGLKDDVLLFVNNKETIYSTKNKITSRIKVVESNRSYILNKEPLFKEANQEELFNLLLERNDSLLSFLSSYSRELNRSNAIDKFNQQIIYDNELLQNEILIIKEILTTNNLLFSENENSITLE